jgi:hypothetical protein
MRTRPAAPVAFAEVAPKQFRPFERYSMHSDIVPLAGVAGAACRSQKRKERRRRYLTLLRLPQSYCDSAAWSDLS